MQAIFFYRSGQRSLAHTGSRLTGRPRTAHLRALQLADDRLGRRNSWRAVYPSAALAAQGDQDDEEQDHDEHRDTDSNADRGALG